MDAQELNLPEGATQDGIFNAQLLLLEAKEAFVRDRFEAAIEDFHTVARPAALMNILGKNYVSPPL